MNKIKKGVYPVMMTPFTPEKEIDWKALDHLIEWYIAMGSAGLFAVCGSGEIYRLTWEERIAIAKHTVERSNGRIPVVAAGTFAERIEEQAEKTKIMADTGVANVVLLSGQVAKRNFGEDVWLTNFEKLLSLTGDIKFGFYESPGEYGRHLSPQIVQTLVDTNRTNYFKDTTCQLEKITKKVAITKDTEMQFFNANAPLLLDSLILGGDGYSGVAANIYPELYVWLCDNFKKEPKTARRLQNFIAAVHAQATKKYTAGCKVYLKHWGLNMGTDSRVNNEQFSENDLLSIAALFGCVKEWHQELGLSFDF